VAVCSAISVLGNGGICYGIGDLATACDSFAG